MLLIICSLLVTTQSRPATGQVAEACGRQLPDTSMLAAQDGVRFGQTVHVCFYSQALDRRIDYWVYLPPGYGASTKRYPVLYMLHGRGGSSAQWRDWGLFAQADRMIRRGLIRPLLIVTPQGDDGYWMNHANGGPRWGDYITYDLIAQIDTSYRTIPDRRFRAIGGVSMGGHGAIQLALTNPGLFAVVGGHSAVFRRPAEAFAFFGTGKVYQQHDPISLVRDLQAGVPFQLWLDIGDHDPWVRATLQFHRLLLDRQVPHSWHLFPGTHSASYWASHLAEYLSWYDAALDTEARSRADAGSPPQAEVRGTRAVVGGTSASLGPKLTGSRRATP